MKLFINKKQWLKFSPEEMTQYQNEVFEYYAKKGFPFFPTNEAYRKKELIKLLSFDYHSVIKDKIIRQTMHGLGLAWSFMPHSFEVKCGEMKTPLEIFNSDKDFKGVIAKRIKMGDNMSDNGIRKMIKMYSGAQGVSNFRPTAAAAIYNKFMKEGDVTWDMSSGFGGRLLGAILANVKYIGTDPATKTFDGLCEMKNFLVKSCGVKDDWIQLHNKGSEELVLTAECVDFCFTSPPYFNWEKYSNESSQSYIKYPTQTKWINGFLGKTFANCHYALKPNKYMVINIANTKDFCDLEEQTVKVAEDNGFKLEDTMQLALSNPVFKNKKCAFKYEPVFVFKRI